MRIAEVIGTVTLNRAHPSLLGGRFKLAVPLTLEDLLGQGDRSAEMIVVYDELGADVGCRIAVSEGREAAMPFYPEDKPLDAYNAAILDAVCARGKGLGIGD
ncbi:MAG: carbon dioxide concentrating mechanism protein CcmL [Pirellulales bacterium]|nr:carbon dioxide concentrating mechanism protein CcmL [Pirellulales bacterium]